MAVERMTAEINRDEVERRFARLREEYDDPEVEAEREVVEPGLFPELREIARDGYTGGGYAWVVREPDQVAPLTESMPDDLDERRRALMILGRGATEWGLPGGGREDGETYEEAAIREVREETGIDCRIEDCFLLRRVRVVPEGDGEPDHRIHLLYVFFDGTYEGGSIAIQPGELNGAAWFAEPPGRLLPANELRAEDWDAEE